MYTNHIRRIYTDSMAQVHCNFCNFFFVDCSPFIHLNHQVIGHTKNAVDGRNLALNIWDV